MLQAAPVLPNPVLGLPAHGEAFIAAAKSCRRCKGEPHYVPIAVHTAPEPVTTPAGIPQTRCVFCGECLIVVVPSVVSKLSLANGLLYTYTLEIEDKQENWYVTAVDSWTGEVAYKVLAGSGLRYDNHYASLFIGPNGTLYVPVWSGIVSLSQA